MIRTPTGFRLKNTPWARSSRMPPSCDFASRMSWERVSTVVTGRDDYDPPAFLNQLLWQLVRDSTPGFPKKAQTQALVQPFYDQQRLSAFSDAFRRYRTALRANACELPAVG